MRFRLQLSLLLGYTYSRLLLRSFHVRLITLRARKHQQFVVTPNERARYLTHDLYNTCSVEVHPTDATHAQADGVCLLSGTNLPLPHAVNKSYFEQWKDYCHDRGDTFEPTRPSDYLMWE